MAARFGFAEDTIRLAAALRPALAARGVPEHVYVDNGSAFVDAWLLRACAKLGIKLVHSAAREAGGPGEDRTVFQDRTRPVPGRADRGPRRPGHGPGRAEPAVHRLGRDGLPRPCPFRDRAAAAGPLGSRRPVPRPRRTRPGDAFRWSEWRTVTKTATVSMHGNRYQVDPGLSGRRVELVFDPFDLTVLSVRSGGMDAGTATPHHITRHAHPKARPEPLPGDDAPRATGIDYLALLGEQHSKQDKSRVNYSALTSPAPAAAADDRAGAGAGGPPWMTSAR